MTPFIKKFKVFVQPNPQPWDERSIESAFPSIPDKKGHDRQHAERAGRGYSHDRIMAGEVLDDREAIEGQDDRPFRDEQDDESYEANGESDAGQGRQGESVNHPPRSDDGGEKHVRNLHHLGKPLADMQSHHLESNDLQNKLRSNRDKEIHGAGLQHLHQTMRSLTTGRLIRYGSHETCRVAN